MCSSCTDVPVLQPYREVSIKAVQCKAREVHNRVGGMSGRGNLQLEQREGSGPGNQHSNSNSDLIDLKVQKGKTTTTTKGLFVKYLRR